MNTPHDKLAKLYAKPSCHMTKLADMLIYSKTPLKTYFSRTRRPITLDYGCRVHPNTLNSFGVMEYTQKFVEKKNIKNTYLQKCIFHQKIGNQLKRTWHHMKAETLKKACVKFEERRLNTLRENRICKKVNLNVNQERAARPPARTSFRTTQLKTI